MEIDNHLELTIYRAIGKSINTVKHLFYKYLRNLKDIDKY